MPYWCKDCKEAICSDCVKYHKKLRLDHCMIPIDDVTEADILISQLNLGENCQKHKKEALTMYCISHEEPCCTICALSKHKACQEVEPLDELAANYTHHIKENDAKCLNNMQKNLENIIEVETASRKDTEDLAEDTISRMTNLVDKSKEQMDDLLNSFKLEIQQKKSESIITRGPWALMRSHEFNG